MLPYYILILVPVLVALVRSKGVIRIGKAAVNDKRNTEVVFFFIIFMVLLMFRDMTCGVDTSRYIYHFATTVQRANWSDILTSENTEIGFYIIAKAVSMFTTQPQVMLVVTSVVSVVPLLVLYQREADAPVLTIVLFLTVAPFSMYFSGIRQALAMAFAVPAWYCTKNKKPIQFIVTVSVAMLFHKSAVILFVIYILYRMRITSKTLPVVLPIMLLIYLFNEPIFNYLTRFLWEDYGEATETGAYTVLILLILFAVYSFIIPDESKLDDDVIGCRNILLLSICIQCFAPVHVLAMRMNYYFLPFIPILIPKIANHSKAQYKQVAVISIPVMTLFFLIYFFWRARTGADILQIYPYIPFWK